MILSMRNPIHRMASLDMSNAKTTILRVIPRIVGNPHLVANDCGYSLSRYTRYTCRS